MADKGAPRASCNGLVNNVQTYWGLEIDIIAISPSKSWIKRADVADLAVDTSVNVVILRPSILAQSRPSFGPKPMACVVPRGGSGAMRAAWSDRMRTRGRA